MDWNELFENLNLIGIIGWIVGIIGVAFISALWSAFKEGREAYMKYYQFKEDGWTTEEKDRYIQETGEFWESLRNLWTAIVTGVRKWFKKKK